MRRYISAPSLVPFMSRPVLSVIRSRMVGVGAVALTVAVADPPRPLQDESEQMIHKHTCGLDTRTICKEVH